MSFFASKAFSRHGGLSGYNQADYTHYVVIDGAGIESGWSYAVDAADRLKDLRDERPGATAFVRTRVGLKRMGLDPSNDAHWLA